MAGAVGVYALCLIAMIVCSMAYNMAENHKRKSLLRRLDHAAIFLMIAGTYTPVHDSALRRRLGAGHDGFDLGHRRARRDRKIVFAAGVQEGVARALSGMGWLVVAAFGPLTEGVSLAALILLVIGGALYTIGVPFYVWEAPALPPRHLARLRVHRRRRALCRGADRSSVGLRFT